MGKSKEGALTTDTRNTFKMVSDGSTESEALAKLVTGGADMSGGCAHTLRLYSNTNGAIELTDLAEEMHKAGREVNAGSMARAERMLMAQFLTLDTLFNSLAQRAKGQETFRCKTACKTFQISGVISVQKLPPWVV